MFDEAMGHIKDKVELVKVVEPQVDRSMYWSFWIKEGDKTITAKEDRVDGTMVAWNMSSQVVTAPSTGWVKDRIQPTGWYTLCNLMAQAIHAAAAIGMLTMGREELIKDAGIAAKTFDNMAQAVFIRQHGIYPDSQTAYKTDLEWARTYAPFNDANELAAEDHVQWQKGSGAQDSRDR